ncbi:MAG TPA: CPBP family intramembrane glutamic endopeptidase [Gaiellaceae bacterium]|jgi:membrane protease YdiL (CAAX protease family)
MRRRLVAWILFVALISSVAYASRFAAGPPERNALYKWSTAVSELFVFAIIIAVTLAITGSQRQLLALRRPHSWRQAATLGVPVFIAAFVAISALDRALHGSREQGLVPKHWEPSHAGAYAANFVVIAGVAPFAEELLFRGLGYSLLEPFGRWTAILTVGIAFGLYHGLVEALPELALFGCALAWLRSRTGSVYPGMLAHATFNAIGLVSVFL